MLKAGDELSINLKDIPDLEGAKKGEVVEISISCKVIGTHTHATGKTERMIDLEVMEFEADEYGEEDEEEDEE